MAEKEFKIENPEILLEMLENSLDDAPIVSDLLNTEVNNIHTQLNTLGVDNLLDYNHKLKIKIAEFIYTHFEQVIVTTDEMVVGILDDGMRETLFDGTDCKIYLDLAD